MAEAKGDETDGGADVEDNSGFTLSPSGMVVRRTAVRHVVAAGDVEQGDGGPLSAPSKGARIRVDVWVAAGCVNGLLLPLLRLELRRVDTARTHSRHALRVLARGFAHDEVVRGRVIRHISLLS